MNRALDVARTSSSNDLTVSGAPVYDAPEEQDRLDLHAILEIIRRRMMLLISVLASVVALALVMTLLQTPVYMATSQVVLQTTQDQIAALKPDTNSPDSAEDRTDTEVEILQSRNMAGLVVNRLDLVHDPDFNPAFHKYPSVIGRIRGLLGLAKADRPPEPGQPADSNSIVDILLGSLKVNRLGETRAVEIAITSPSARTAAAIANEYARLYKTRRMNQHIEDNRGATRSLADRLDQLRAQAQIDTQNVQQYRIAHNLLSTSGASLTEQEISSYNQEVATARAQAVEDDARLATARDQLTHGSTGEDVGEALGSSVIGGLRSKQADISGRLATLESRYGDNYPDVIKARSELADVNTAIQAEIKRVISNLEAKRAVSAQRLSSLTSSLAGARGALAQNNGAFAGLDDLERRAQASQAVYDSYLNRYKGTVAADGTQQPDADVISWAEPPVFPSSPRTVLNLFLGGVLGLGLGFVAAFLAETLFSGLTSGAEVEQRLRLPYLASVPLVSSVTPRIRGSLEDVVLAGRTPISEVFRGLRTSLNYVSASPPQVIAITSALPKEGKTSISIALARSIAIDGERVLVIDCDGIKARLSKALCSGNRLNGLVEVLKKECSFDEAVVIDKPSGAHILPLARSSDAGTTPLVTRALFDLIDSLRDRYDHIILDTAPVLPVAETRLAAALADATLFVVHWRQTPDHAVKAALRLLPSKYVNVAGVLLSRVDLKKQGSFAKGDRDYYYRKYSSYYS